MSGNSLLMEIRDLKTWFGFRENPVRAVDGVSFVIPRGSTVALVGESGCGKSVTALSLARLVSEPPGIYAGGQVLFEGKDILGMTARKLAGIRGRDISYVFQEPGTSLNPVFTVGYQIMESVRLHRKDANAHDEAVSLLDLVGLPQPESKLKAYPHELSGGMQQRVMIAMALACRPKLLVADEPTTALDVTIQAQILELLASLQKKLGMSVLLITHNLGLVADMADIVNVMYAGRIVETGRAEEVLADPAHPYTKGLLDAVPRLDRTGRGESGQTRLKGIPGTVPHPAKLPKGCKFVPRCSWAKSECRESEPLITDVDAGEPFSGQEPAGARGVRCFFPLRVEEMKG